MQNVHSDGRGSLGQAEPALCPRLRPAAEQRCSGARLCLCRPLARAGLPESRRLDGSWGAPAPAPVPRQPLGIGGGRFQHRCCLPPAADWQNLFPLSSAGFFPSSPSVLGGAKHHLFHSFFLSPTVCVSEGRSHPPGTGHLLQRAVPGPQLRPLGTDKVIFPTPPAKTA